MWRRWNQHVSNGNPYIGHPTLIETTVEEGYLETIPEVDSVKSKRSSASTTLPELPFRAMPYQQRVPQQYREPAWSQPSPTIPDYHVPQEEPMHDGQFPYVSPASSPPRSNIDAMSEVSSISPIEPEGGSFSRLALPTDYRSRIPQRVVSDKSKRVEPVKQDQKETLWDVYSGEPTRDNSGQPSTVRPGTQPLEHQYPQLKERTRQILAGLREREAASKQPWSQQPPPVAPAEPLDRVVHKEPWRGYSGRTALVDPIQDDPLVRNGPIQNFQKKPDYAESEEYGEPFYQTESPSHTLRSVGSEESIKPIAPLKIAKSRNASPQSSQSSQSSGSNSPLFYDTSQSVVPAHQQARALQSPFSSPGPTRSIDIPAPLDNTRADSPYDIVPDTPRTPSLPMAYQDAAPIKVQQMPSEPDVSRFSWTTYATTTVTESPGSMARIVQDSPPPPMPPIPQLIIRKRPVSGSHVPNSHSRSHTVPSPSSALVRKPVGSKPRQSSAGITPMSLSKTLPQIPSEVEATDKMTNLEAQMNALSVRKYNTTRIIRDLNETLKKNAIIYNVWQRKDISERISSQEEELQTITNEEHEIGLLLHRARRKRDMEDNFAAHWDVDHCRRLTS